MAREGRTTEQIIVLLREAEVRLRQGEKLDNVSHVDFEQQMRLA